MENNYIKVSAVVVPVLIGCWHFSRKRFNGTSYHGKRILVTGASSGIGEKIAYEYAKLGAKLVITARRVELLERVKQQCEALGSEMVVLVPADMAKPEDRAKVVSETLNALDGLDILILNHGIIQLSVWTKNPDRSSLEHIMQVNFISFVDVTSMLLDALNKSNGSIGVVSSVAGKFGNPFQAAYSASKHALQGFYSSLRQDFRGNDVKVSVTLAVFGVISSDKMNELIDEFKTPISMNPFASSTESAAKELVEAVDRKDYEMIFPAFAKFLTIFYKFFPDYFDDMYGNSLK